MTAPATSDGATARPVRPVGLIAMIAAVLCFSLSSTLIRKAAIPGPTLAFWRMAATTVCWWTILWVTRRQTITLANLRMALVPGIAFGFNLTCFFLAVNSTSIANAEFIGALTPLVVVPAGAIVFHERVNLKALSFGIVSLFGLVIVLFNGPANGTASRKGDLYVLAAMLLWATYLLSSRRMRATMGVAQIMSSVMPIATATVLPIVLLRGELTSMTTHAVPYVIGLTLLTGTVAHGLVVFAQHTIPLGTIGILQVGQPALAVGWAYLLLDQALRGIQVVGMVLVIAGLVAVVLTSRRSARITEMAPAPDGFGLAESDEGEQTRPE